MPLWEKWLSSKEDLEWHVVLGDGAKSWINRNRSISLPTIELAADVGYAEVYLKQIWAKYRPDTLVSSATGALTEFSLIRTAIEAHTVTIQFIDSWYGYQSRFKFDGKILFPDIILVLDELAKSDAIYEGLPSNRIKCIGNPSWDGLEKLAEKPSKNVLFIAQPIRKYYGTSLGYDECIVWNLLLKMKQLNPDMIEKLCLLHHPAGSELDLVNREDILIETNSERAMEESGTVIGMFSSLLVDACILGKTVISLQPGKPVKDMCSLSRHGYIQRTGCIADMVNIMAQNFTCSDKLQNIMQGSLERLEDAILLPSQEQ